MATSTFTAGQRLTAAFMREAYPKGVIAQGIRTSNKTFTTVTGYLRLDSIPLLNGRVYLIMAQNLRVDISAGAAANDHYKFEIRYDGTGAAATTTSTEIGRSELTSASTSTAQDDSFPPAIGWVLPSADVTGSFLLTATRTAGAATVAVQADTGGIFLTVFDMGFTVADSGVDI